MKYSLRTKLSFSYVAIILIGVAIVSILTNVILEKQFKEYIISQQDQNEMELALLVRQSYISEGKWDTEYLESVGMNALDSGMILKVLDSDGHIIWDTTVHNDGMCQQMLNSMRNNMQGRYGRAEGGYEEKTYLLENSSGEIGKVTIGYYGPYYYTENDLDFINTLNKLLIFTAVISIVLALVLGVIISRQISKPVSRVIHKAGEISNGSYGEKIVEESNTKEIVELVSAVNNLAETLKKQEALSKQASLDIAHELRTPLTTVQGNLEAALDGVMEMDSERIGIMHEEILRISRLVDDLSKLSKYESESSKLDIEEFDISDTIENIVKTFEGDFKKERKSISFAGESRNVSADRDKINQVIVNLISNAKKYTSDGGEVKVSVEPYKNRTKITVEDNGIGISAEDLPMVFERFYRADKSRNRRTGGAGIGLTIVKTIIEAHGGEIEIESEPGKGTKVKIIL